MDILARLAAESDIRNLVALYPQLADDAAVREWSELFAHDGVLRVGTKTMEGRAALAQWLAEALATATMRHICTNVSVVMDSENDAHGITDLLLVVAKDGAWTVGATSRYADRYVRTAEGWRFAERVLTPSTPAA